MPGRIQYLFKNVGILTISNFASKILVFLLVPLYTSILSTVDVGIYDLVVSTVTLVFPIISFNISDAVMRFLMDKGYEKEKVAYIGISFIGLSNTIVVIGIFILSQLNIWPQIKEFGIYIALFYFFYSCHQLLIQMAKGYEKVSQMGVAGVLGTITMIGANIILLLVAKLGIRGFFIANILSHLVPVIYFTFKLHIVSLTFQKKQIDRNLCKKMLMYSTPLISTAIGWWVNSTSDRYIVSVFCGVAANGILSVSYKIPQIINTLQQIFTQAWQISAIKEYDSQDSKLFYGNSFGSVCFVMGVVCSCMIILTKPTAQLLYQNEFYSAWQYVPFLLISCVLNSASGFLGPILAAKKDSKSMALSAIYGASLNLILNIILVQVVGVQGVTFATVVASFVIFYFRKRAASNDVLFVQYWNIIVSWILLCIQALVEIYTPYWWIECIIMALMVVINREKIKDIYYAGKKILFHKRVSD